MPSKPNALYCGDNLAILRDRIADESVDLIYLDPPFNSKRDYNLIFRERGGKKAASQELVFGDTWEWNENADDACRMLIESGGMIAEVIRALRSFLGTSDMMAYIAMMAPRLVELRRVLKDTGSIYLHCDPTASHYLKIVMDAVFGGQNFKNEIVWKRTSSHSAAKRWGDIHDTILFYSKTDTLTWNEVLTPHSPEYTARYRSIDATGRAWADDNLTASGVRRGDSGAVWRGFDVTAKGLHWKINSKAVESIIGPHEARELSTTEKLDLLDSHGFLHWPTSRAGNGKSGFPRFKRYLSDGCKIQDIITDIPPINSQAQERLGYPTQKPEALLERIIKASSNPGDVILDPFCGCGTAVQVAQELNRRWIGIDVTHLSLAIIKQRLASSFGQNVFKSITVVGEPVTEEEAIALASSDKFGFQCWAVGRLGAPPIEHKRGADRGIDGRIYFHDDFGTPKQIIISVKAGEHIGPQFVRELRGVVDREKAEMGILVLVKESTSEMKREAAQLGMYKTLGGSFPRLQIFTIRDIFANRPLTIPGRINPYERKGPSSVRPELRPAPHQLRLLP